MNERILFQHGGGVAVIVPESGCGLTVEQIAIKDVPPGVPFWIVDVSDVPADRTERNKWIIDIDEAGDPDGYGG